MPSLRRRSYMGYLAVAVSLSLCVSGCKSEAEQSAYSDVIAAESQLQSLDPASNPETAVSACKQVIEAMDSFLNEYPSSQYSADVQQRRDALASKLAVLQAQLDAYHTAQQTEPRDSSNLLPSQCRRAADAWRNFLTRYPNSHFSAPAQKRKDQWEARLQAELQRGFQLVVEEAEISPVKGPAHGFFTGRPWDPEIFGASAAPDPYLLVVSKNEVLAYAPVIRDTLRPPWHLMTPPLHISDDQEISIVVRDRDVAEKAALLFMGKGLFTFSGITAAQSALKADDDDDIGRWTGTLGDLLALGKIAVIQFGDVRRLDAHVVRP